MAAAAHLHKCASRYADPKATPPVMARRGIDGGPWDGRGITIPDHITTLECGWASGQYQLEDVDGTKRLVFRWHTRCPKP